FTADEFKKYITDNLETFKNTIANNIQTGWNQTLDVNKIENIQLNDLNQLVISLDSDFVKYSISRNSSVIGTPNSNLNQENSQLIINNLQFYTQINISDNDLINIKTKINEYIENNNIASGNNISSEQLKQFMQNIKATILPDNTQSDLLSLISSVSFVNNSVQIIFNNLIKINDKEIQNQSISISNNTITISNFDFKPSRDFYTWSGNTITGLTDLGKQQTDIILPAETTGILNNVFTNNTKIVSVDMSNTQITKIPLGLGNVGLFMNCTSLKSVILPNNLTSIGAQAFKNCSLLNSINLPNALEDIGMGAFYKTNLSNIIIPDTVKKIEQNAFQYCSSLLTVTLPNTLTEITEYAFAYCTSLKSINIPDSITQIGYYSFAYSENVVLHCSNETVKSKVSSFKILSITPDKIVVDNFKKIR
ncbi:MAG: leucine-rich repeat protein, partial [Ureaplasma sp.]|nr:leucine-rich repeat protein [Ureaplasma sp.]